MRTELFLFFMQLQQFFWKICRIWRRVTEPAQSLQRKYLTQDRDKIGMLIDDLSQQYDLLCPFGKVIFHFRDDLIDRSVLFKSA